MKILYDYFPHCAEKSSQISISNKSIESSRSSSYVLKKVSNSLELKKLCFYESIRVEYEKVKGGLFIRFILGRIAGREDELIDKKISSLLNELYCIKEVNYDK